MSNCLLVKHWQVVFAEGVLLFATQQANLSQVLKAVAFESVQELLGGKASHFFLLLPHFSHLCGALLNVASVSLIVGPVPLRFESLGLHEGSLSLLLEILFEFSQVTDFFHLQHFDACRLESFSD